MNKYSHKRYLLTWRGKEHRRWGLRSIDEDLDLSKEENNAMHQALVAQGIWVRDNTTTVQDTDFKGVSHE